MANRWFTQFYGSLHKKPVQLDCNFVVDSTNGNGLGIRSLKGPGIANVFMNTSASFTGNTHTNTVIDSIPGGTSSLVPGMLLTGTGITEGTKIASITGSGSISTTIATTATNSGVTVSYSAVGSPKPAAGIIVVQFQDNFNRYFFGTSGFVSPVSGSPVNISSGLTKYAPYTIVSLGTSTTANWQAVGLPIGITPAVGVSFVASTATAGTGSGIVEAPGVSGIFSIEVVGDPNQTLTSSAATVLGVSSGAYVVFQCLAPTVSGSAYDTPIIPTAPANGSVIGLSFFLSNSTIKVQGE
jgi:hypothetical protein